VIVRYVLPVIALGLLIFAVSHVRRSRQTDFNPPPPVEPSRSPFGATVAGAGIVEAQTENISIGSPLPGVVVEVKVVVDQKVKAGDELFRLDDRALQAELKTRNATLLAAQADLTRLDNQPRTEQIPVQEAKVHEAEAGLKQAQDAFRRARSLLETRAVTEEEVISQQQAVATAQAKVEAAQAELKLLMAGAWQFDKAVAKAAVEQAAAQVEAATIELGRLVVRALVPGEVLQVNVRPGEFVGAPPSQALIVLGAVQKLHVRVDIDENDIPRFRPGAPAKAMLRGNPEISFPLQFVRVEPYVIPKRSLTGQNTERVDTRVLQVIYALQPSGDKRLYVGQQVDVVIEAEKPQAAEQPKTIEQPEKKAP
jgi:multidrug resistance efflux pump